ncbi:hypothetical protein OGAPHI_006917 [Ogataea philodendri]|uniref:AP-2 complex subunit alpha n=1 Tax=Ogataea philodendri TaxID=1378263 RepID=A0A9P8SZE3_9ASCO|nr:uncharacterized protein OGAPHI_006917 [Ogataea philodendri]KAH3660331.1 hypothetical protein OGAPHI_006917 [Ogataea philodendri]
MSQMKGLVQFITDIRNAKEQEQEHKRVQSELVHIQKQFQQSNLSGYHRKKYICKLLYIYLMGHDLSFGMSESIALAGSKVYSEKCIGYLALSIFLQTQSHNMDVVFDLVHSDLSQQREDFICLGLQFLSAVAESDIHSQRFETEVFSLIRSPVSSPLVRKKAVLTLLQLFKVDPLLITRNPTFATRIVPLINDPDFGVSVASVSLVQHIAKLAPELCTNCITLVVEKLHKVVVQGECPENQKYYGVPAPWLTVKLFQLLETLVPDIDVVPVDNANMKLIKTILQRAISTAISQRQSLSLEARHTRDFILFGAISLAAHVDPSPDQLSTAVDALCQLLESPETNIRYLALGALGKLATRNESEVLDTLDRHNEQIFSLLRDRDVSVRRLSLDLIYIVSSPQNVEDTCSRLLEYLSVAEFVMKSEVAVKIAVLAEKHATDANWYVTTMMRLISVAGNYLDEEVRQRLIQIVVNNDSIQPTACRLCYASLKNGSFPESMVKVAGFLLGEFGHKLDVPLEQQFDLLYGYYPQGSVPARCILLSSFLKFYHHSELLRPRIIELYEQESNSFSAEVQQRSLEYLKLTSGTNQTLLSLVVVEMPPFQSNISPLIPRLGNVSQLQQSFQLSLPQAMASSSSLERPRSPTKKVPPPRPRSRKNTGSVASPAVTSFPTGASMDSSQAFSQFSHSSTIDSTLSASWKEGYYRQLHYDQGIFYEDTIFKIVYRMKRDRAVLHFDLTYSNKSAAPISGLTCSVVSNIVDSSDPGYIVNILQHPESGIAPGAKSVQKFDITVRKPYLDSEVPTLNISFMCGGYSEHKLRLAAVLGKILTRGSPLTKETFFARWSQVANLSGSESQKVVKLKTCTSTAIIGRAVQLFGFNVLPGIDPNANNIVCAGILSMAAGGAGCLCRIETNPQDSRLFRVTMRCTMAGLADILVGTLVDLLNNI